MRELFVDLPRPHAKQRLFIDSSAKRKVIRAGRRSGKTEGVAILSVERFLAGRRQLYAAPTMEQVERYWTVVTRALQGAIDGRVFRKNETMHLIELPGTEQRIRAKTAWNADTLRGDYADDLYLDEFQLMCEDAWGLVGAPMLLDNDGDAAFVYTPPSLHSRSVSKARDPRHASKLFASVVKGEKGPRWEAFSFTSHDNPHISEAALRDITGDMTRLAYRQEIMAEDVDEAPGALWTRDTIEKGRVLRAPCDLVRVVVGLDPSASADGGGDEAGIITAGVGADGHAYVTADDSLQGSPLTWAKASIVAYHRAKADRVVAEANKGGEMVRQTITPVDSTVPVTMVHASRGKATRAEPIAAQYEQGRVHHVGNFQKLEDEMAQWVPGDDSPNRMDALVWAITDLLPLMSGIRPGFCFSGASAEKKVDPFDGGGKQLSNRPRRDPLDRASEGIRTFLEGD